MPGQETDCERRPPVIAVDGPAASGKGTLAGRLASHFGFAWLETGLLYRAVAHLALSETGSATGRGVSVGEFIASAQRVAAVDLALPQLREERVAQEASKAASIPEVRAALLAFQRTFAQVPPGGATGAVLDGRDIGTVVWPQAQHKFFVTASLAIRAERRLRELRARGLEAIHATVLREMRERDVRDSGRSVAPLAPAEDALIIDSTDLSADAVFATALAHIQSVGGLVR